MKKKFKSLYIQLYRNLIKLPMSNKQGSVSIEYIESVLKEVFDDNKPFSFFDYLMYKAFKENK